MGYGVIFDEAIRPFAIKTLWVYNLSIQHEYR